MSKYPRQPVISLEKIFTNHKPRSVLRYGSNTHHLGYNLYVYAHSGRYIIKTRVADMQFSYSHIREVLHPDVDVTKRRNFIKSQTKRFVPDAENFDRYHKGVEAVLVDSFFRVR